MPRPADRSIATALEILPAGAVSSRRVESKNGPLFVKRTRPEFAWVLEAEAQGLELLRTARTLRVPQVRALTTGADEVVLELEWIASSEGGARTDALLGQGLARQHRSTAERFGWERKGTIGRTTQLNDWSADWVAFVRERRLRPQLDLATRVGGQSWDAGYRLLEQLPELLGGHHPVASLLHGDLWAGNWGADEGNAPVIFDPAVYYGDREADLAMTRLFGGFGRRFYEAYTDEWPLEPGHVVRERLYQLYHLLNHANLFGGDYVDNARHTIQGLLAETRG